MSWAGYWSERAGIAETDIDRIGGLLEGLWKRGALDHLPDHVYYPLTQIAHEAARNKLKRYGALPSGPTLQGNLASGGWDI